MQNHSTRRKLRVLWLTNMPAPYRFSVWDEMSKHTDLEVVFVCGENNWRSWKTPESTSWKKDILISMGYDLRNLI